MSFNDSFRTEVEIDAEEVVKWVLEEHEEDCIEEFKEKIITSYIEEEQAQGLTEADALYCLLSQVHELAADDLKVYRACAAAMHILKEGDAEEKIRALQAEVDRLKKAEVERAARYTITDPAPMGQVT